MRHGFALAAGLALVLGTTAIAQAPIPDTRDKNAVKKWISDNKIDQKGTGTNDRPQWGLAGGAADGIYFVRRISDPSTGQPGVLLKQERFAPITVRDQPVMSHLFEFELNCNSKQVRRTNISVFAEHNNSGASISQAVSDPWGPFDSVGMVKDAADAICRAQPSSRSKGNLYRR